MKMRLMAAAALIAPFLTTLANAGDDAMSGEARNPSKRKATPKHL